MTRPIVIYFTTACAALVDNVPPEPKVQDDGQATKTHAEVAVGRPHDLCGIADHHRVRGVDGCRGGITGHGLVDAPAVTQRRPSIHFTGWPVLT